MENKKSKIDPNTFLPIEEKKEVGVKSDRRKIGKEKNQTSNEGRYFRNEKY